MRVRVDRRASAGAVLGVLLASALAGCGNAADTGGSAGDATTGVASPTGSAAAPVSSSATATSTPSGAASGSSSSAPSTPAASGSAAGPAECSTGDLAFSLGSTEGAAGSTYYRLRMTNASSRPCRTGGYGGVSLVSGGDGTQVGAAATREHRGKVVAFLLPPRGHATATLQVVQAGNYPRAKCRPTPTDGLRVYPPNETRSTFVRVDGILGCRSRSVHLLSLTPYQPAS